MSSPLTGIPETARKCLFDDNLANGLRLAFFAIG